MTVIRTESCDSTGANVGGGTDKWDAKPNNVTNTGRTGTNGYFNGNWRKTFTAAEQHATFVVGQAVAGAASCVFCTLLSDANTTTHLTFEIQSDRSIKVYRGTTAGTLLGQTAAHVLGVSDSAWRYLEVKATLSDTVGTVDIHVDGASVLSLSGIDTKNGGTMTVFDTVITGDNFGGMSGDDLYIANGAGSVNNDFLGPVRIYAGVPSGNGGFSQFVGSDGNSTDNYLLVHEQTAVTTTDYVEDGTAGDRDTYPFTTVTATGGVKAVALYGWAEKTDANARGVDFVSRLSGTEVASTPSQVLVNGVYHQLMAIFETKPGGGSWTVSDVNAAEFGFKVT